MFTFLFVYSFAVLLPSAEAIQVQISGGTIEGKVINATYSPLGNQTGIAFLGIPYAEPPLGDLRFRKPRPPTTWQGIRETNEYKPACMSNITRTYKVANGGPVSEDCLYLNVFTNDYCMRNKNCSVMIVVHGGAFLFESASAFAPDILINNFVGQDRNIVVVSINYRLGIFGFGQFRGDSGDRNIALFDILQAVKFVRNEIGSFGGNKNRITLAGHSAGAALTFLFSSSPLSKGLIHQQIIMSGPLANMAKQANYKATTYIATRLGCLAEDVGFGTLSKKTVENAFECLRNVSADELLAAELYMVQNSTHYLGCPHVDGEFVTDYPDRFLSEKRVYPISTMLGTTSAELRESQYITDLQNTVQREKSLVNLCEHIGYELFDKPDEFAKKCYAYYRNGSDAQFLSDDMEFYAGSVEIANAHSTASTKVFLYSYTYTGAGLAFKKYMPTVPSPHHSEDLIYTFGTHRGVMAPKDYVIESIYSGVFANFVNFGDPSPSEQQKWRPYSEKNREYFEVDFDQNFTMPGMKTGYYKRAVDFWSQPSLKKNHREQWSPSLDTLIITNLVDPILSHMRGYSIDTEKLYEPLNKLFYEREQFLNELKTEWRTTQLLKGKIGNGKWARSGEVKVEEEGKEEEEEGGGVNILLIIFAGVLLLGILYISITHFCLHVRSREGYQLLK
ncbi:unnamed protein product [Caenorhabditis sp. 36 PRJEB53466]|nr:unnamed protein product [Caenorhabditis sp. 36 PRJEB53466]